MRSANEAITSPLFGAEGMNNSPSESRLIPLNIWRTIIFEAGETKTSVSPEADGDEPFDLVFCTPLFAKPRPSGRGQSDECLPYPARESQAPAQADSFH
jgi:hypothetical protein